MIKNIIFFLIVIIFLIFVGSGNFLTIFYGDLNMIDEGQFGAWVSHMLNGELLYRDFYAAYGPLYIYPLYFLSKYFGPSVHLIRFIYIFLSSLLGVMIAWYILRKLSVGFYLVCLTLILIMFVSVFGIRQAVGILTLYFLWDSYKRNNNIKALITGMLMSCSFLISSDTGIFISFITLLYILFLSLSVSSIRGLVLNTLYLVLGILLVFIPFYLYSNYQGWYEFYINSILTDLKIYSSIDIPLGKPFPYISDYFPDEVSLYEFIKFVFSKQLLPYWVFVFYMVVFIVLFIKFFLRINKKEDEFIALASLYGFLLSFILIGRTGHVFYVLPIVLILLSFYLNKLMNIVRMNSNNKNKYFSVVMILFILLFYVRLISIYRTNVSRFFSFLDAQSIDRNTYIHGIFVSDLQYKDYLVLKNYIDRNISSEDRVYFFDNDAMSYMLYDLNNPTRYDLPEVANTKQKRLEVLDDLRNVKPKYIIYNTRSWEVDGISNFTRLPEVANYIDTNYKKILYGNFIIYIRF